MYSPAWGPVTGSELDIKPWPMEESAEDLSSWMPLVEKEMECRLGEMGLDVLVGDTDAEKLGGEPVGVIRGVVLWEAMRRL